MASAPVPSRAEALVILQQGQAALDAAMDGLDPEAATRRPEGEWSAKDFVAHVTFWEDNALQALQAWTDGAVANVDRMLEEPGEDAVNAAAVEASFALGWDEVVARASRVHGALIEAIEGLDDDAWVQPALPEDPRSIGLRLGAILVGSDDDAWFDHVRAHTNDLDRMARAGG